MVEISGDVVFTQLSEMDLNIQNHHNDSWQHFAGFICNTNFKTCVRGRLFSQQGYNKQHRNLTCLNFYCDDKSYSKATAQPLLLGSGSWWMKSYLEACIDPTWWQFIIVELIQHS